MAKQRRIVRPSTAMGPASPRSKHSAEVDAVDAGKGKKRKSKMKRPGRDKEVDPVADRAALEEESARALMLLSASALQNDNRGPYYNLDDGEAPLREPNPLSVENQIEEQAPTDQLDENSRKKRRIKGNDKRRKGSQNKSGRQMENDHRSSSPENLTKTRPPQHPLDEEPSDDELVQEYETGRSREQPRIFNNQSSQVFDGSEKPTGATGSEGNARSSRTVKNSTSSKKRKRQAEDSVPDQAQSQGLPIDPSLHALDALQQSSHSDPLDTLNANALPELHQRRNNEKKMREPPDIRYGESASHNFSEAAESRDDGHGTVNQSLEDDDGPIYSAFDLPEHQNPNEKPPVDHEEKKKSDKGGRSGKTVFTAAEVAKLDNYRDRFCKTNDLIIPGFNHLIQLNVKSNEHVNKIFNELSELFPDRTRAYVQRFCRRRFHNFHARGVWTPEEDADLRAAVAEKGTAWKAIGELLGRFNEDCRDRYRNYLAPSAAHRNKDAWTEKEVINLSNSVLDCMHLMKEERQRAKEEEAGHEVPISDSDSDQEAEDLKLVNWQTVSDMMIRRGTPRSRIQCSFKWSKIKKADRDRYLKDVKEAQKNLRELERGDYTANNMKRSTGWRLKAAAKQIKNMKSGDKYDLLNAILDSAAPEEDNIPWRVIGDEAFRQKWSFSERKAGWFAMKKQVEGSEDMDYRQVVQILLKDLLAEGIEERWDPPPIPPARKRRGPRKKDHHPNPEVPEEDIDANQMQYGEEGQNGTEMRYENNEAAEHVRAAPVPNMRRREYADGSQSPNSLFDGAQSDPGRRDFESQRTALENVSPELAQRVRLLQAA